MMMIKKTPQIDAANFPSGNDNFNAFNQKNLRTQKFRWHMPKFHEQLHNSRHTRRTS